MFKIYYPRSHQVHPYPGVFGCRRLWMCSASSAGSGLLFHMKCLNAKYYN